MGLGGPPMVAPCGVQQRPVGLCDIVWGSLAACRACGSSRRGSTELGRARGGSQEPGGARRRSGGFGRSAEELWSAALHLGATWCSGVIVGSGCYVKVGAY